MRRILIAALWQMANYGLWSDLLHASSQPPYLLSVPLHTGNVSIRSVVAILSCSMFLGLQYVSFVSRFTEFNFLVKAQNSQVHSRLICFHYIRGTVLPSLVLNVSFESAVAILLCSIFLDHLVCKVSKFWLMFHRIKSIILICPQQKGEMLNEKVLLCYI